MLARFKFIWDNTEDYRYYSVSLPTEISIEVLHKISSVVEKKFKRRKEKLLNLIYGHISFNLITA